MTAITNSFLGHAITAPAVYKQNLLSTLKGKLVLYLDYFEFYTTKDQPEQLSLKEKYCSDHQSLFLIHDNLDIDCGAEKYQFSVDSTLEEDMKDYLEHIEELRVISSTYSESLLDQCINVKSPVSHPFFRKHVMDRSCAESLLNHLSVFSDLRGTIYRSFPWYGVLVSITEGDDWTRIDISDNRYLEREDCIEYRWEESRGGFFDDSWSDIPRRRKVEYIGPSDPSNEQETNGNIKRNPFGLEGLFKFTYE